MSKLRQRIPFRLSDNDDGEDNRILDEQEQEEVIETLRSASVSSTEHHYKFLQGCLGFMTIFHVWFLISRRHVTPMHIFFPNTKTPLPRLIPFATLFTLLDILLLLNVVLHLPKSLSFPRFLHSIISKSMPHLPLRVQEVIRPHVPLSIGWTSAALSVPLLISVLTFTDKPQILWWSSPLIVVGVVVLVMSWIKETETEMARLENLKYEAKGA